MSKALCKADDQLAELVTKASRGDRSVLPAMRRVLDDKPELWQFLGDLGHRSKMAWIDLASGENELRRETLTRQVEALQRELEGPSPSALERLLAERVVGGWLEFHCLDPALNKKEDLTVAQAEFYDRRRDRAHHRLLAAMRTLATVRRLVIPALQVKIGHKQINVARSLS